MLIDNWAKVAAVSHRVSSCSTELFGAYRLSAQRFQFTDESVQMAAGLCRDYPNLLISNYQFAVPPYETTYIEYDVQAWVNAFGPEKYQKDGNEDDVVGHLIHKGIVCTAVAGVERDVAGIAPWLYTINPELDFTKLAARHKLRLIRWATDGKQHEDAELASATVVLGSLLHDERAGVTDEIVKDIHERVHLYMESSVGNRGWKDVIELIKNFRGELRTLWQLLLFINQPKHLIFDDIPASRRMVGNRSVAFPRYRLVRVKPKTTVHHISRTFVDRMKPGLHDVRAFWRNFEKDESCEHDWPLLPDEEGRFKCARCSQWRVRVKEFKRGDPSRPVVRKGYQV
jgi:hypothetical protein